MTQNRLAWARYNIAVIIFLIVVSFWVTQVIKSEPEVAYSIYQKNLFEPSYENSAFSTSEKISTLLIRGTPGEQIASSFSIKANQSLSNLNISAISISDKGLNIDSSNIDIRIVNFENRKSFSTSQTKYLTPFALLKDDTRDYFSGGWTEQNLPQVPNTGSVKSSINQGKTKQFWVRILIPASAKADIYQGKIKISANGQSSYLPIKLIVLPFKLVSHQKIIGIYYTDQLAGTNHVKTSSQYQADLKAMREIGFNSIVIPTWNHTLNQTSQIFDWLKQYGFSNYMNNLQILSGSYQWDYEDFNNIANEINIARQKGFNPYEYAVDEPNISNKKKFCENLLRCNEIHNAGGKTTSALEKQTADQQNSITYTCTKQEAGFLKGDRTFTEKIDMPIYQSYLYPNTTFYNYLRDLLVGKKKNSYPEMYYWQDWRAESIGNYNRINVGFGLYSSKLNGAYAYCYQNVSGNPYNQDDGSYADMLLTYPIANGYLPTINSEAIRTGANDLRYAYTFNNLISELKKKKPQYLSYFDSQNSLVQGKINELNLYNLEQKYINNPPSTTQQLENFRVEQNQKITVAQNTLINSAIDSMVKAGEISSVAGNQFKESPNPDSGEISPKNNQSPATKIDNFIQKSLKRSNLGLTIFILIFFVGLIGLLVYLIIKRKKAKSLDLQNIH